MTDNALPEDVEAFLLIAPQLVELEGATFDDVVDWAAAAYAVLVLLASQPLAPEVTAVIDEIGHRAPLVVSARSMTRLKEESLA